MSWAHPSTTNRAAGFCDSWPKFLHGCGLQSPACPALSSIRHTGQAGWTLRQVVHHLADAQANWYVRTRLALTEFEPLVKPFDEVSWAELADARTGPVEPSLLLCDGLGARWVALFESLSAAEWARQMIHPDRGTFVLEQILPMHVWHGRHHTAQITSLRQRMGWQ